MSAGLLPSTLLVPVPDALATAAGVAVAVGVAEGCAVGVAVGTGVGVGVAVAEAEAAGVGDAVAAAVIEGAAEGDAVGVAPLMGVSVDEPLQAVKIAAEAQRKNAAVQRCAENEFIVDQSQTRSKMYLLLCFKAGRTTFCKRSYR
jgi:hypothetical protein